MQERRQFSGGVKYILPEFQQQGTALLPGAAVLTPTSLILSSTTPCELCLDSSTIFLLRSTIFLSSRASNLLSFVQGCHTVSSTPCHGAWTSAPLRSYPFTRWERTASISQIEIPICARRTTTHQFIWWQQHMCGALGGLPMECGLVGERATRLRILIPRSTPTLLEWPCREQRWSGLSASASVSDVSAPAYTNGAWSLLRLWVWRGRNRPLQTYVC